MSTLIITLPCAPFAAATPCDSVLSADGQSVLRHMEAPVALLPAAAGADTVVVVPAAQLSWHRLELPRGILDKGIFQDGQAQRLRTVLDGLLEERVLDEPALLHFALEPQARSGAAVWVAACNRAWLNDWLAALEQSGRAVSRIVPEISPPTADTREALTLLACGSPEAAQLVCRSAQGVAVLPLSAQGVALANALHGAHDADIVAEPSVAALAEHLFQRRVTLQTRPQRSLEAVQSAWDMAQFDLLRTRRARTRKRASAALQAGLQAPQWRPARWAALALVLVNLLGLQAWAWKEQSALTAKRAAIRNVLTSTFPEVRLVVDAPLQMERAVADLQRQSGAASRADLEALLQQVQAASPATPVPSALEFSNGALRLQGLDPGNTGLADVTTRLRTHGYAARVEGDSLLLQAQGQP